MELKTFLQELEKCTTKQDVLNFKAIINSQLQGFFRDMKSLSVEEKKAKGQEINEIKIAFEDAVKHKLDAIRMLEVESTLKNDGVDITLNSFKKSFGSVHPATKVMDELTKIMQKYGFNMAQGPEIETNYYNFDALNVQKNHPARDMHDTFYLNFLDKDGDNFLLRTHTSSVQIRSMKAGKPPFALISAGRTYRCDFDRTHTPMFNQMECLFIDKGVSMSHLMWMIQRLFDEFFAGIDVKVRLRPSYFPFTEPSAEVDINIGGGFLEVMGAGMTHPNVLKECGIDPNEYSGFAFGVGIERLAMLKYGIKDLRDMFNSNAKWNESYGFRI